MKSTLIYLSLFILLSLTISTSLIRSQKKKTLYWQKLYKKGRTPFFCCGNKEDYENPHGKNKKKKEEPTNKKETKELNKQPEEQEQSEVHFDEKVMKGLIEHWSGVDKEQ